MAPGSGRARRSGYSPQPLPPPPAPAPIPPIPPIPPIAASSPPPMPDARVAPAAKSALGWLAATRGSILPCMRARARASACVMTAVCAAFHSSIGSILRSCNSVLHHTSVTATSCAPSVPYSGAVIANATHRSSWTI